MMCSMTCTSTLSREGEFDGVVVSMSARSAVRNKCSPVLAGWSRLTGAEVNAGHLVLSREDWAVLA